MTHGDGVYKSTDAGRTWANVGPRDTRHIGRVRIHPEDPDLVYVAALGHAFGPNEERGVFRSGDGGASWEKTLFKSDKGRRGRPVHGPRQSARALRVEAMLELGWLD